MTTPRPPHVHGAASEPPSGCAGMGEGLSGALSGILTTSTQGLPQLMPKSYLVSAAGRRQYLFQHTNGTAEVFTAVPELRNGKVTLLDIEDRRWITERDESPFWADQIHDHVYGGEE